MDVIKFNEVIREIDWKPFQQFFDMKVKQLVIDLVQNSKNLEPKDLIEAQATIEAYQYFMELPRIISAESRPKDVKESTMRR